MTHWGHNLQWSSINVDEQEEVWNEGEKPQETSNIQTESG